MRITISNLTKQLVGEGVFHDAHYPTLVLCHGLNTDHTYPLLGSIYQAFQAKYNVFSFDFRGQGQSSGDYHDITLNNQVDDINDIITYLNKTYHITSRDITLLAHSQGGCCAMLWAARTQAQLAHLILISPGFGIVKACQNGNFAGIQFDPQALEDHLELLQGCVIPKEYILEARGINLKEEFQAYPYPVDIFYSLTDELVPFEDLKQGTDYIRDKTLYEFKTNHHYIHCYEEVNERIKQILEK